MRSLAFLCLAILILPNTSWSHNGILAHLSNLSEVTINGSSADWPDTLTRYPIAYVPSHRPQIVASDLSASFRGGFDPAEGILYILVEVEDDTLVVGQGSRGRRGFDGCRVVLDADHADGTFASEFTVIGTDRRSNGQGRERNDWAGVELSVQRTESTHIYEWKFSLGAFERDLGEQVSALGFDIEIYDVD